MKESSHKKYALVESFDFTDPQKRADFFSLMLSLSETTTSVLVMLRLRNSARKIHRLNLSEIKERIELIREITCLKIYDKDRLILSSTREDVPAIAVASITRIIILEEMENV